ncbi:hypothetical protein HDZ31DRAFT_61083 [Schizophyllum fasciatum]
MIMDTRKGRHAHRRAASVSTPHVLKAADGGKGEAAGSGLSRIVTRVRRSLSHSYKRRRTDDSDEEWGTTTQAGPADRMPRTQISRRPSTALALQASSFSSRPTIEQIAMGLHVSRTPHLRGGTSLGPPTAASPSPQRRAPLPPPARSALKQADPRPPSSAGTTVTPGMSASGSTADTSTLETPTSVLQPAAKPGKARGAGGLPFRRMSAFLTHTRAPPASPPAHKTTPRASTESPKRRVVRFEGADA